jgi:hypothetical protein
LLFGEAVKALVGEWLVDVAIDVQVPYVSLSLSLSLFSSTLFSSLSIEWMCVCVRDG